MINNVNSFLVIYDETKNITRLCEDKYQIAEQKVYNAVNALHSIIHSLENQILIKKLNRSHRKLNILLKQYLKKIFNRCQALRIKYDLTIENRLIAFDEPKPYNFHDTVGMHSYEYY